jgi:uncharacterized protein involved in response to NO
VIGGARTPPRGGSALFAGAFRIFFVSVAIWALVPVPLWLIAMFDGRTPPLALPALLWHQHELLFGWLHAAIAGFLLTAVCVWTSTPAVAGARLLALWLVWLAGRASMLAGAALPDFWAVTISLAFLPLVAIEAGHRIVAARQWRQLVVLLVLAVLWTTQLVFLTGPAPARAADAAMLATLLLMVVIGGRITPAFSTNWLRQRGDPRAAAIRTVPALEAAILAGFALVLACTLFDWRAGQAAAAAGLALLTALRLLLWRGWNVAAEPLLWILHLSLAWVPLSLLLLAGALTLDWPRTAWLHAAGIGAMGSLILGVVSRVLLGHTGRALQLPSGMVFAYLAIQLAAVLRIIVVFGGIDARTGLLLAGTGWVLAFALLLWRYAPMAWAPRPDGRPG